MIGTKNKILLIGVVAVLAIGAALFAARMNEDVWICQNGQWVQHGHPSAQMPTSGCGTVAVAALNPASATYTIEGKAVTLKDGTAQTNDPSAGASQTITKIFGANTQGDINGDGLADTAVILTQNSGGSGTFYYIAAAIKTEGGYKGTNAVLLGDRIAPQNNRIQNGEIIVNYADRNSGEDFSVRPSLGKSMYLVYSNNELIPKPQSLNNSLPIGYTLANYSLEKITETSCTQDSECVTPMEYAILSRCPFTSLCLNNKCTVVCPSHIK
jgi:hypothetical protein